MTTATAPFNHRWQEIKDIWHKNPFLYGVIGFLVGLIARPFFNRLISNLGVLLNDFVPEFIGIVFTVVVIDHLYSLRDKQRA